MIDRSKVRRAYRDKFGSMPFDLIRLGQENRLEEVFDLMTDALETGVEIDEQTVSDFDSKDDNPDRLIF